MSNNRGVDYNGTSHCFALSDTHTVADIERHLQIDLGFQDEDWFYVAVEGRARLIRDKAHYETQWSKELENWFQDGIDPPGLVMIRVDTERLHWWDKGEEREIWI